MKPTRRILTLTLGMLTLISCLLIPTSAAGNVMYGIGFVNATSLRLRSAPSTTSAIVSTASNRDCVVVIRKEGDWYQVNYNLQEGYMHKDYLTVSTRENAELGYGEITGSGVNLRSGPSTSHGVVARGSVGDRCYILGINAMSLS